MTEAGGSSAMLGELECAEDLLAFKNPIASRPLLSSRRGTEWLSSVTFNSIIGFGSPVYGARLSRWLALLAPLCSIRCC
ncbi:hypothetical protein O3P69_003984 [Scylla paramamosain]|uniref:Uncharacterized protein n=1 Tax=Scylla paramamosain TaxID=85552 RepID=A0AAW0UFX2_SCYPA